jgi:dTDP-4-amino-4,6-dideoxygalactose transaminase
VSTDMTVTLAPRVAFLDVKAAYSELQRELDAAYHRVMDSGRYILGEEVEHFEHEFASFCGTLHCVGVGSGLDALHLLLRAHEIGEGAEVIVPSNTFIATWLAVTYAGARPVPVEPDPKTFNLDPLRVAESITPRTRAIMPVHLYGRPAQMDALLDVARQHKLIVIEDAAQAHGAAIRGKRAGAVGNAAAFSFYPGKNLGAFGDGGAITTNDASVADRVRMLRNYGSRTKYQHELLGYNSRLDPLQAALLSVKLRYVDEWNERRRTTARYYSESLIDVHGLQLPDESPDVEQVWHLYVIRHRDRDRLRAHLEKQGVGTLIHYPIPPHLSPAYASLGYEQGDFPIAEELARTVLSLPIGPHLTRADAAYVVESIRSFPSA